MQIPVLNGIYTDEAADFRTSYPVNMVPVALSQGISRGYLRPAAGITTLGTGPGIDRGAINWNGTCYRVMGTKLVTVADDGTVATLGDVGGSTPVTFDYSFDRLAIASNGNLFYWNGTTLTQVTDGDLGTVLDVLWVDGYFMTTDGTYLVVTELSDPTSVNPLKYGSSEADPDPVKAILKLRNEVYALNRHTIEVFDNVGGDVFPFARIEGAQIQKGTVGSHSCCVFLDVIAFLGGGRNESLGLYLGANGSTTKISTREIDTILAGYSETELSGVLLESRMDKAQKMLLVHLPDRTLAYDAVASESFGQPCWHILTSTLAGFSQYTGQNAVRCYDKWIVGNPATNQVGVLSDTTSAQWGSPVRWEFATAILHNEGMGAIVHQLELVSLTGRTVLGKDPRVYSSYSVDGETWSNPIPISAGKTGQRGKRLVWFQQGRMRNWRIQRFRGTSDAFLSVARLEAIVEPMA